MPPMQGKAGWASCHCCPSAGYSRHAATCAVSKTGHCTRLAASQWLSLPLQVTTGVPAPYSGVKALVKA